MICLLMPGSYKVGDQPPKGYIQWHEWVRVQHAGGLRQKQCPLCKLWKFPQDKCECKEAQG